MDFRGPGSCNERQCNVQAEEQLKAAVRAVEAARGVSPAKPQGPADEEMEC